jgi:hypothetical protein
VHELESAVEPHAPAERFTPTAPTRTTTCGILTEERFETLLGIAPGSLPAACRAIVADANFAYDVVTGPARDAIVLRVLQALDGALSVAGPERISAWEHGWSDVLARFEASGGQPAELWPHYLRPERRVVRLEGEYVLPVSGDFEANFVRVMQAWFGATFLADATRVYEFGCGPGHNLVALAGQRPERSYMGLDWAPASQKILAKASARLGLDIVGRRFVMVHPDPTLRLAAGAGVVTFGALEQLGTAFDAFLDYLLEAAPAVCVHLEPIHELYDPCALFDVLAARYSEKRGYLRGFLTQLRALERRGRVEVVHVKKHLGSLYHDGWVSVVWRPCGRTR